MTRRIRTKTILGGLAAAAALCAAGAPAGAAAYTHLDPFGALVADRLELYPDPPADRDAKKLRKALLRAQSALAAETVNRAGDLAAAKRAAAAVERPFAGDDELLDALDDGLVAHFFEELAERDLYDGMILNAPLGKLRRKLEASRAAVDDALADSESAVGRERRASDLARAAKGLAKIRSQLYDGDCPRVLGPYFTGLGTVTFDDGSGELVATDCTFEVDSATDVVDTIRISGTVAGSSLLLSFAGPSLSTGSGVVADPQGASGDLSGSLQIPGFFLQPVAGAATVEEFGYAPVPENAYPGAWGAGVKDGRGRIRGTFTYTFCQTVSFPGEICGGVARTVTGTFDVCNPVIYGD
ncbi:MAG: hypothetical protein HMLKMBBP_02358 [Planctomycetes bacterium]|nr:hypothetical protein [Planctomycetota bacterium]